MLEGSGFRFNLPVRPMLGSIGVATAAKKFCRRVWQAPKAAIWTVTMLWEAPRSTSPSIIRAHNSM
jgi:hypothetical protein